MIEIAFTYYVSIYQKLPTVIRIKPIFLFNSSYDNGAPAGYPARAPIINKCGE